MEVSSHPQSAPLQVQQDTRNPGSHPSSRVRRRRNPNRPRPTRESNSGIDEAPLRATSAETLAAEPASAVSESRLRGNNRSRGRGRGRGRGARPIESRNVNGRTFGGALTRDPSVQQSSNPAFAAYLQRPAPVFVPGVQQHAQLPIQTPPHNSQAHSHKRRLSKSQAPDIATRTHEDIDNDNYECPICTSEVVRKSKVWSCHTCWTVFHLSCIKKWSSNEGSSASRAEPQGVDHPPSRQWRCPGCNLPKDILPKVYTCWCEKETDPRSLVGIPPHSCGQSCGRTRANRCPHPCQLTCHAGPCPPCTHMGPTQACFCGKHETTKRCTETDYSSGWSCGESCGALMPCGEHTCARPCHEGPCGDCDVRLPARCYCGQTEKDILCSDKAPPQTSHLYHLGDRTNAVVETWTGVFDCSKACDRLFDCDIHRCTKKCHVQDAHASHCPRSPDLVTSCPCGKTPLKEICDHSRSSCEDPIPNCGKSCDRLMNCGHLCPQICHTGDCPPCLQKMDVSCRCRRVTTRSVCHQGSLEPPQCMRVCRANMNCGRHACEEHCCTGERKALERQATKRKQRPLQSAQRPLEDLFEAEHICTRQCGRPLKCGNHFCDELCHKGPCGTCREAIFHEISCNCGRTVLQPPLPCGTQPPPCRYPCERPKTCGHPQVGHTCHQDSETCPRCPFLVEKRCMCGKKSLKNQQCWLSEIRCGEICGAKLRCGVHHCRKPCHKPGECEDANGQSCQQACSKEKKICGHPDEARCHAPFPCKEDKPCSSRIFITCACQAQKQETKCGASCNGEGNIGKTLPCNEECTRLERNRKLALALNIDSASHVDGGDHIPYSNDTLSRFASSVKWAQTFEREFRVFAESDDEKRLRFKPMQPNQRAFLHSLAADFGFDSESVDPEPHRHVLIWKTPRFVSAPNKTLADSLRLRQQAQRVLNANSNVSDHEDHAAMPVQPKPKNLEPFNGFVVTSPRFGLTIDEVRVQLNSVVQRNFPVAFDIQFLPNESVVLKAMGRGLSASDIQGLLENIKGPLSTAISTKGYGTLQLCVTDSSLNITRFESDGNVGRNGWSQVAAKKAAPRMLVNSSQSGASANAFSALSSEGKMTFAKKRPDKKKSRPLISPVVDDWEAAELSEEEKESAAVTGEGTADSAAAIDERDGTKESESREEVSDAVAGHAGIVETSHARSADDEHLAGSVDPVDPSLIS